tara:strand:- start:8923 stop:9924 length:1002 start_codon:yes stop_codon:yes gene_type:complete
MKFFNKKEEVIDFQLTQYGKHLLSQGEFTPVYYAFFDDGILYDSQHVDIEEEQNNIIQRIKNETPTLKTQHVFSGAETRIRKADVVQLKEDKIQSLSGQLGNGKIGTDKIPAWDLKLYQGEIREVGNVEMIRLTGSNVPTQQIPQIDVRCTYNTYVVNVRDIDESDPRFDLSEIFSGYSEKNSTVLEDGTFIQLDEENLILDIFENNTDFQKGNFDIEIFMIEELTDTGIGDIERITPLKFKKAPDNVVNDILLDDSEIPDYEDELDPTYVEYYFDIYADTEIDRATICRSVSELKAIGHRVEIPFHCEDIRDNTFHNIYKTNILDEDIETCQ